MAEQTIEARSGQNGRVPATEAGGDPAEQGGGLLQRVLREVARQAQRRIPRADLDERDSDYIREKLPMLWLVASIWFRGEVRGLGNIPESGPVLLVGNHSGGNLTPDTTVFTLAFNTYFGVERAFYQLAHNLVLSMPALAQLRKFGTVAASPENASKALESGAALLVYPGGDYEVHRPTWQRNSVDFGGRKGFIRLALDQDVPIVPVVSIGGQETALFLSRGERLARLLALDRIFRLKVLPISVALPWGLWSVVSDPERALTYLSSMTRWEVAGEQPTGLGARYRMLFRIGSAEVGGLIEVVEWEEPHELAWTSVTGVDQRGRYRLREERGGVTRIELRLAYGVAGSGLWGWVAERVTAPTVGSHLRQSLRQLKRLVEHEQLRERAAARRATRAE